MAGKSIDMGGSVAQKLENLTNVVRRTSAAMENLASGRNVAKYWHDQEAAVEALTRALQRNEEAFKSGDQSRISKTSVELINNMNALKAIVDASGKSFSDVVSNVDRFEKAVANALKQADVADKIFNVDAFKDLFPLLKDLESKGLDVRKVFEQFSTTSNTEELRKQLQDITEQFDRSQITIKNLKRELENAYDASGISSLREEINNLSFEIDTIREKAADEFLNFARANRISDQIPLVRDLFDEVNNGSLTANEAITDLKHQLNYLFENNGTVDSGIFDTTQWSRIVELIEQMGAKVSELHTLITTGEGFDLSQSLRVDNTSAQIIENIVQKLQELATGSEQLNGSAPKAIESITQLMDVVARLTGSGKDTLDSLRSILSNLKTLSNADPIKQATINSLSRLITNTAKAGDISNLRVLSGLDFSRFDTLNNIPAKGSGIATLARNLPKLANVPVAPLEALSKVNFANIAAGLAPLDGKTIKFAFDYGPTTDALTNGIGKEGGALDSLTKKFQSHTTEVQAAVHAEQAKLEQAHKLTEALEQEEIAAKKTGESFAQHNAITLGTGFEDTTFQNLEDGLKKLGIDSSASKSIADYFKDLQLQVTKVDGIFDPLTKAIYGVNITAKDATGAVTQLFRATKSRDGSWGLDDGRFTFNLEKQQKAAAKAQAREDKEYEALQKRWAAEEAAYEKKLAAEDALLKKQREADQAADERAEKEAKSFGAELADQAAASNRQIFDDIDADLERYHQRHVQVFSGAKSAFDELFQKEQQYYQLQTKIAQSPDSTSVERWKQEAEQCQADIVELQKVASTYRSVAEAYGIYNEYTEKRAKILSHYQDVVDKQSDRSATTEAKNQIKAENEELKQQTSLLSKLQQVRDTMSKAQYGQGSLIPNMATATADAPQYKELIQLVNDLTSKLQILSGIKTKLYNGETPNLSDKEIQSLQELFPLYDRYEVVLKEVNKINSENHAQQSRATTAAKGLKNLETFWEQNGDSIRRSATETQNYFSLLDKWKHAAELSADAQKKLVEETEKWKASVTEAGLTKPSALQRITDIFGNKMLYGLMATMASQVRRLARQVYTNVSEINGAMTQLKIVTGASDQQMTQFLTKSTALAKELGQNITDVLKSVETFSRLGFNLSDSSELAKYTNILANVANVDTETATSGLTSIIKGFDLDVSEAEHISDVLVKVGQSYAVSAGEIMAALERGGAALHASNTSFEKSVAIIAAANASLQSAETAGTLSKTISARIRGSKTELEELGESYEDCANGISKYRDEIKALTNTGNGGFDIMADEAGTQYKDIYDIFVGLADVWGQLNDTTRSRISEILGGTRNLSGVSSIIQNIADATGAYADAMDSAGVATKANAEYLDSIAGKVGQLQAAFQEFSTAVLDSEFVKWCVDALKGLTELGTQLAEIGAILPTIVTIFSAKSALGGPKDDGFHCAQVSTVREDSICVRSQRSELAA